MYYICKLISYCKRENTQCQNYFLKKNKNKHCRTNSLYVYKLRINPIALQVTEESSLPFSQPNIFFSFTSSSIKYLIPVLIFFIVKLENKNKELTDQTTIQRIHECRAVLLVIFELREQRSFIFHNN